MPRKRVIVDTDCGADDAIGIMYILSRPDLCDLVAITTVWGNVPVEQGLTNIKKLLDLYNCSVPLHRGAEGPLIPPRETTPWGGFGKDGFGDAAIATSNRSHGSSSVLAILDAFSAEKQVPGMINQLICIGPLTNIALALSMDPTLPSRLGGDGVPGLVVMGGATEAKGNSSLVQEFNLHCDPEAAAVVFGHAGFKQPIWVVSWELSVACGFSWSFYDRWIGRPTKRQNEIQQFIEKIFLKMETHTRPSLDGSQVDRGDVEPTQGATCVIPDVVAAIVALDSTPIQEAFVTFGAVELRGAFTRGMLCLDWYGTDESIQKKGRWRNLCVVMRLNQEELEKHLEMIVSRFEHVNRRSVKFKR